jgi:hypothetical protein
MARAGPGVRSCTMAWSFDSDRPPREAAPAVPLGELPVWSCAYAGAPLGSCCEDAWRASVETKAGAGAWGQASRHGGSGRVAGSRRGSMGLAGPSPRRLFAKCSDSGRHATATLVKQEVHDSRATCSDPRARGASRAQTHVSYSRCDGRRTGADQLRCHGAAAAPGLRRGLRRGLQRSDRRGPLRNPRSGCQRQHHVV